MIRARFIKELESFQIPAGATVTVALSGGMDSVVLLFLFKELAGASFRLEAAHVNHGIRGAYALRDQQFAQRLCRDWEIPIHLFSGDARAFAALHGMSLEEGARALRYRFLDPLADGRNGFVATAHHQGDQLETFFINLYRGSGSGGLAGIQKRRGGYLRPLLQFEKEEISAFAKEEGLPFVTDETNADTAYLRNFIRHRVLPLLNSRPEGQFSKGLQTAMACLRAENEALTHWADSITENRTEVLAALPEAVLKRVLNRMNGGALDRIHFEQIAALLQKGPPSGQIQISEERCFRLEYGRAVFVTPVPEACVPIRPETPAYLGAWMFQITKPEINNPFTHFSLDCDKMNGNLVMRHKKPGDRFRPMGRGGTSQLLKRLKNDRVPRSERDALWILADEEGHVLWVERYGADQAYGCDGATKRFYEVKIGNNKGEL